MVYVMPKSLDVKENKTPRIITEAASRLEKILLSFGEKEEGNEQEFSQSEFIEEAKKKKIDKETIDLYWTEILLEGLIMRGKKKGHYTLVE